MTVINFGKHKGKEVKDLPIDYLRWLQEPVIIDRQTKARTIFEVPSEIKAEAEKIVNAFEYAEKRLVGMSSDKTDYIAEGMGDIRIPVKNFDTLESALIFLESLGERDEDGKYIPAFDPEDDRVLVWEILPSGHKKVVWHFSGWHWDSEEFGFPQGAFIGHEKDVYSECMEDY